MLPGQTWLVREEEVEELEEAVEEEAEEQARRRRVGKVGENKLQSCLNQTRHKNTPIANHRPSTNIDLPSEPSDLVSSSTASREELASEPIPPSIKLRGQPQCEALTESALTIRQGSTRTKTP